MGRKTNAHKARTANLAGQNRWKNHLQESLLKIIQARESLNSEQVVTTEEDVKVEVVPEEVPRGDKEDTKTGILLTAWDTGRSSLKKPRVKVKARLHRCLFCYEAVEGENFSRRGTEMEGSFTSVFILKKMLSVPSDTLLTYLKTLGNPSKWVVFCDKCQDLVDEAMQVQKEIGRLEKSLRRCQETMIRKIRETWKQEQNKFDNMSPISIYVAQKTRKLHVIKAEKKKRTKVTVTDAGSENLRQEVPKVETEVEVAPSSVASTSANIPPPKKRKVHFEVTRKPVPRVKGHDLAVIAAAMITKACEPRKQVLVLRQKTYEDDDKIQFYFDRPDSRSSGKRDEPRSEDLPVTTREVVRNPNRHSCPVCPARKLTKKQLNAHFNEKHRIPKERATAPSPPASQITGSTPFHKSYGSEDKIEFDFDGAETSTNEGSHSSDTDPQPDVPGDEKILIDEAVAKALNEGTLSCPLCQNVVDLSAHKFANHVQFHYRRPLKCAECHLYYANLSDRRVTQGDHQCSDLISVKFDPSAAACWRCHSCSEIFSSDTERDLHENSVHFDDLGSLPRKKYPCNTCVSSSFRNLAEWRLHRVLEHPSIDAMSCYYCDATFQSKTKDGTEFFDEAAMIAHVNVEHGLEKKTPLNLLRLPNECLLCGVTFDTAKGANGLSDHVLAVHGVAKHQCFACPVCPTRRTLRTQIQKHLAAVHVNPEEESFICDLCAFPASSNKQLENHKFSKHGVISETRMIFQCSKEECRFQCLEKCKMDRHLMKEHGAERKHKCRFCGKGFLKATHCRDHEEIHLNAGLKPFQCEICGNSFAIKNYLYIHKRLSHQNRPFVSTHKKKAPRKKPPSRLTETSSKPISGKETPISGGEGGPHLFSEITPSNSK